MADASQKMPKIVYLKSIYTHTKLIYLDETVINVGEINVGGHFLNGR